MTENDLLYAHLAKGRGSFNWWKYNTNLLRHIKRRSKYNGNDIRII